MPAAFVMGQCKLIQAVSVSAGLLLAVLYLGLWVFLVPEATLLQAEITQLSEITALPTLGPPSSPKKSREAYVTLQYGSFFLGLRVLGQSLRESGTERDMVALCMPDVPEYHRKILRREGWIVRTVNALPKSYVGDHTYSLFYTKLQVWLLTEYRRVVYIDSDAIVQRNVDELGEFCAAYRHSDLFNAGVVVLKPSEQTFTKMCTKILSIRTLTSEDQSLLNYFYEDMAKVSMFSPSGKSKSEQQFERLPSAYNGDVGIFYLTNRWWYLDTEEPYVLHYTLGRVKPWMWWSYPLFPLNWRWKSLRDRLPPVGLQEPSLWDYSSWFPLALLLALALSSKWHLTRSVSSMSWLPRIINPVGHHTWMLVCTLLFLLAFLCAFFCVPETMNPIEAWTRCGLWTLLFFSVPFLLYCHLAYVVGTQSAGSNGPSKNTPVVRPWRVASEALLWLATSGVIFYLQFWLPLTQTTMKRRILTFFGLWFLNFALCYICGRRFVRYFHSLGSHHGSSISCPL